MPKHGTNIEIIKKTLKVAILQSHEIKIYNIYSAFFLCIDSLDLILNDKNDLFNPLSLRFMYRSA